MILQHIVLPAVYFAGCLIHRRVNEKLVVFADAHHTKMPFSMEPMFHAVKKRGYQIQLHLYDYSHESAWRGFCHSVAFMFLYSGARYIFLCDNFLPVASCRKRKETTVTQLWHSCGLLKKMGYDTVQDVPAFYWGNVYRNYDLVTVSAPCCVPFLTSGMRQSEGVVKALGVSRTDVYFDLDWLGKCQQKVWGKIPEAKGKHILLWAPTFRGNASAPTLVGLDAIKKLEKVLGNDWYVLIKAHPHIDQRYLRETGRLLSNCAIPAEQLLPIVDLLVTDYSSILFDYIFFEKPFVLFAPDLNEYQHDRGFYVEYESLTSYLAYEGKDLGAVVLRAYHDWKEGKSKKELVKCREFHNQACDGNATTRILDYLEMRNRTC